MPRRSISRSSVSAGAAEVGAAVARVDLADVAGVRADPRRTRRRGPAGGCRRRTPRRAGRRRRPWAGCRRRRGSGCWRTRPRPVRDRRRPGRADTGAPLGQRPTSSEANRTGVVPASCACCGRCSPRTPARPGASRRHTRYDPRAAQPGKFEAAAAGSEGCCGSWRCSPRRNCPGQTSGWPGLANSAACGSARVQVARGDRGRPAVSTAPRTPGWETPSLNPKCSWPARLPGRFCPRWSNATPTPFAAASATTSATAVASVVRTVGGDDDQGVGLATRVRRPPTSRGGRDGRSPSGRRGTSTARPGPAGSSGRRTPRRPRRPASAASRRRVKATASQVASRDGSAFPVSSRSARNSVRNSSTSRMLASRGPSQRNQARAASGSPNVRNRKCWWSLLKPGSTLPWMSSAASLSHTGSAGPAAPTVSCTAAAGAGPGSSASLPCRPARSIPDSLGTAVSPSAASACCDCGFIARLPRPRAPPS